MALSLGLSLEHRTHTRPKLEPDLAMQLTLARVGWVCWGDAHRDVDCDTVHNQPVLVRTQRRTQTWVECHEQHCVNTLASPYGLGLCGRKHAGRTTLCGLCPESLTVINDLQRSTPSYRGK